MQLCKRMPSVYVFHITQEEVTRRIRNKNGSTSVKHKPRNECQNPESLGRKGIDPKAHEKYVKRQYGNASHNIP